MLFRSDNFSRPAKRSGAWMSTLAVQHRNGAAPSLPVVLIVRFIAEAPDRAAAEALIEACRSVPN